MQAHIHIAARRADYCVQASPPHNLQTYMLPHRTYVHAHIQTYIHTYRTYVHVHIKLALRTCILMHIDIRSIMDTYTDTYMYIHTCIDKQFYIHIDTCIHAYIPVHIGSNDRPTAFSQL